ncbi:uncharacterized protein LOC106994282 isoform X3 [Macaca mulatta]
MQQKCCISSNFRFKKPCSFHFHAGNLDEERKFTWGEVSAAFIILTAFIEAQMYKWTHLRKASLFNYMLCGLQATASDLKTKEPYPELPQNMDDHHHTVYDAVLHLTAHLSSL